MSKIQYMKKIAKIIVETNNKGQQSFKPTKISDKYGDAFEIDIYNDINDALSQLVKEGYITIKPVYKSSTEVAKITIRKEKVAEIAKKYSLITTENVNAEIIDIFSLYENSQYPEIKNFIKKQKQLLSANKSVKFVHNKSTETLKEVLLGANAILSQYEDILLRELSIKVYKDSKILENRIDQIFTIINEDNIDKNTFLQQHHIFRNQTYVLIKGNAVINFNNGDRITLSYDNNGSVQFSKELVKNISSINTKSILSIENLTSFEGYQTISEDGIILYLGGFSNDVNIDFINKAQCPVSHFGDIDASGFKILHNLSKRINRTVLPYKMNKDTIEQYIEHGKEMNEYNKMALTQMLCSDDYSPEEKECFKKLIEAQKTIEQEIIK